MMTQKGTRDGEERETWLDGMATVRWTKPTSKLISVRSLPQVTDVVSRLIQLPKDPGEKMLIPLAYSVCKCQRGLRRNKLGRHTGEVTVRQDSAGWSQAPSTVQCKDSPQSECRPCCLSTRSTCQEEMRRASAWLLISCFKDTGSENAYFLIFLPPN